MSHFKYEKDVLPHIEGNYEISSNGELTASCPICHSQKKTFSMTLKRGLFQCTTCGARGNIVQFIAYTNLCTTKEAYYMLCGDEALERYAEQNKISFNFLKVDLNIESGKNYIKIPYFDENKKLVATKKLYINQTNNTKMKSTWYKDSKICLYGLWQLKYCSNEYIILVQRRIELSCFLEQQHPCFRCARLLSFNSRRFKNIRQIF